jgi:AcrR family transcriptional regulator
MPGTVAQSMQICNRCIYAVGNYLHSALVLRPMEGGLRERKKQRTREQIVEAAIELFDERGYHATTVADIAAAADIAPRTFFAYFPSKEDVVFHDFESIFASIKAALEERPEGETAIDALRRWLDESRPRKAQESKEADLRHRLIEEDPGLAAHSRHLRSLFDDLLREGVARDLGDPPDSLRPTLVAAAATAAVNAIEDSGAGKEESMEMLDQALVFLRAGVEALRPRDA